MTRGEMRTLLRKRIQEVSADQWTDSDLNSLLNVALSRIQTLVMKVHPDAFLYRYYRNIEANNEFYGWPAGLLFVVSVETKTSASGSYKRRRPMKYVDTLDTPASSAEPRYARVADFLVHSPTPTENISQGIRIWGVPTLTMAADSDVPAVVLPLHIAAVYWAQVFAVGETKEVIKVVKEELAAIISDIPQWYHVSGDEPATLDIDLGKDITYGMGVTFSNPGVDNR